MRKKLALPISILLLASISGCKPGVYYPFGKPDPKPTTYQSANQTTNQTANQTTNQTANQATNQTDDESEPQTRKRYVRSLTVDQDHPVVNKVPVIPG